MKRLGIMNRNQWYVPKSSMWTVVKAVIEVPTSSQLTTVPLNSLFTEFITRVEMRGELPWPDVLMKVNVVEFTIITDSCACSVPSREINRGYSWSLPRLFLTVKLHLRMVPLVLQVSRRESPSWQTEAASPGDKMTRPVFKKIDTTKRLFKCVHNIIIPSTWILRHPKSKMIAWEQVFKSKMFCHTYLLCPLTYKPRPTMYWLVLIANVVMDSS